MDFNPGKMNFVGLVTDDPASPQARISVKRRIWRLDSGFIVGQSSEINVRFADGSMTDNITEPVRSNIPSDKLPEPSAFVDFKL